MVVSMSNPHPHSAPDLALAPILIRIERNLARLRDSENLAYEFALSLNDDNSFYHTAVERAQRVRRSAVRDVDLHGWSVEPTPDNYGLAVTHGEYTVAVMFGRQLTDYVIDGPQSADNSAAAPSASATT
jgi:hypothetical protein